jgi:hypothetical protein
MQARYLVKVGVPFMVFLLNYMVEHSKHSSVTSKSLKNRELYACSVVCIGFIIP